LSSHTRRPQSLLQRLHRRPLLLLLLLLLLLPLLLLRLRWRNQS
jgi:hypothetical protein